MTASLGVGPADFIASHEGKCCRCGALVADAFSLRCDVGCDLAAPFSTWQAYEATRPARVSLQEQQKSLTRQTPAAPQPAVDALTRTSPDQRTVMQAVRVPKRTTPMLSVRIDGALVISEDFRISKPKARAELVTRCPEPSRDWIASALLELSEAWSTTLQRGTQDASDTSPSPVTTTFAWPEPVDLATVLDDIVARVRRHLYLPKRVPELIAMWVAATHAFQIIDGELRTPLQTMPLFWGFSATKGCGKSRTLAVLHVLSARSFGSENCSTAAAFRIAAKWNATLVFDEVDMWLAEDTKKEFVGFLNASFTRGGMFTRVGGDDHEVFSFPVFGPRAFAGIGTRLADATRSRSVRAALTKKPTHIRVEPVSTTSRQTAQWADPLRARLSRAVGDAIPALSELIDGDGPLVPAGVEDRAADAWSSLLAIAEVAGGDWPDCARAACAALTSEAAEQDEDEGDIGVRLLHAVRAVFDEQSGRDRLTPEALRDAIASDPTSPWADYSAGKPISTRAMAVLLRRFSIKSQKSGNNRWYALCDFRAAFERYPTSDDAPSVKVSQASQASEPSHVTDTTGTLKADKTLGTDIQTVGVTGVDDSYWGSLLSDESAIAAEEVL